MADREPHNFGLPENGAQALGAADELRRAGRTEEAERICLRLLESDPKNAEAHYLLAMIAFEKQTADQAELHMAQAVALVPEDPEFHFNLGNARYMQGKLEEAAESFQAAIRLDSDFPQAYANLGLALTELGNSQEAVPVLRQALSLDPENPDVLLSLGNALQEQRAFEEAADCYRRAIRISPDFAAGHRNLGNALASMGLFDQAEAAYHDCLRLEPQFKEAYTELGLTMVANGKLNEAARHFVDPARAFRAVKERPLDEFPEFNKFNKTKLQHDIEQLDRLIGQNKISSDYAALVQEYRDILGRLGDRYEGLLSALDPPPSPLARSAYNRIIYHEPSLLIDGGVLAADLDTGKIEKAFHDSPYGFTFFDGLLRDEALRSLRAFCLDSTIWCLIDYEDEIESNLLTGFACPLIFQIASEIKQAFPGIFGPHTFTSSWAYKYFQRKSGLGVHCDDGAVSINFWITPDEANNDPEAGGLVMWNKKVSRDFLGEMTAQRQDQFSRVLAEPDAQSFKVPYRCNRAVIFHSNVLHGTDAIDFKPGYENNRINMTFLYGKSPKKGAL